jgi:hypothetical protein
MTFKESYNKAKTWQHRAIIVSLYHNKQLIINKKWRIADSAKYFQVSTGMVSESIKLSERFDEIGEIESRNEALKRIR